MTIWQFHFLMMFLALVAYDRNLMWLSPKPKPCVFWIKHVASSCTIAIQFGFAAAFAELLEHIH